MSRRRLEELTPGAGATVADPDRREVSLRRAGDRLRHSEGARQAAILNALPAHIALLDTYGCIVSVNESWRRFDRSGAILCPGYEIGVDYLGICDSARGDGTSDLHQAVEGMRSVLSGGAKNFSLEYPFHSPTEQRWFQMTVTPLSDDHPDGAVVMHLDVTQRRRTQAALAQSEAGLHHAQSMAKLAHVIAGPDGTFESWSETLPQLIGVEPAQLPRTTRAWLDIVDPACRALFREKAIEAGVKQLRVELEYRLRRADGQWIHIRQTMEPLKGEADAASGSRWFNTLQDVTAERAIEDNLRLSESRFRQMAENIDDLFFLQNLDGSQIYYVSPAYERIWGRTCESLYADPASLADSVHPDDRDRLSTSLHAGRNTGFDHEYRIVRPDGELRWIHVRGFPILDDAGNPYRTAGIASDITERKEADKKIKRLNRVYAVLSGINALIVRVHDREELFREACRIAIEHGQFRISWLGLVDRDTMRIVPVASAGTTPEHMTFIKNQIALTADTPAGNNLVAQAIREKKVFFCNDTQNDPGYPFREQHVKKGTRSVAVLPLLIADEAVGVLALYTEETGFFDDDELKLLTELAGDIALALDHIKKAEKLNYLAYYDVLTGLANRSLFLERVAQYMRSAASGGYKLALFLVDLERFKNINDSLGRPAGDALLRQVAEWLTRTTGDDNLVARVGADHFAVMMPEVKQGRNLARFLEKAMASLLEHPFRLDDAFFRVAAKAGVALFPDDGADADTLFKHAEAALKKAKASGDRFLFYTQTMTQSVAGKLTLENKLRLALDKGEFVLHYQPKVNLATGKLAGAEALIRWNDPLTGLVPPGRFIPVLEETGLIHDVGRWALRQALADYLRWRAAGLPAVRIAVNVSPLQLRHRGFIAEIEQAIGIDSQAAAGLELEITESMIMQDVKHSIASLQAIRALGITIAIDDFGTGFSSLSHLSKLPVDTLKIDRSFVVDMTAAQEGLALVQTIIGLAHALRLKVVAEGVETEEQSRLLRLLNCDEMQGFLFSKAVPGEIFEARFLVPLRAG